MPSMLNSEQLLTAIRERVDHPATARELVQRLPDLWHQFMDWAINLSTNR